MPSAMSNMTTSPSSLRPIRCASVPPIWPAPIKAILGRAMGGKPRSRDKVGAHRQGGANRGLRHNPFQPCRSSFNKALGRAGGDRVPMAVRQGKIALRAHLDEPRCGALELLRLETFAAAIERVRLGRGGCEKLHRVVVQRR